MIDNGKKIKNKKVLLAVRELDSHYRVMQVLQNNPKISQRELSIELGVSLGKLNYCLKALVKKGWVKVENFNQSRNKMKYIYLLTPKGIVEKAHMTQSFLGRKIQEYDSLRAEIEKIRKELSKSSQKIK